MDDSSILKNVYDLLATVKPIEISTKLLLALTDHRKDQNANDLQTKNK